MRHNIAITAEDLGPNTPTNWPDITDYLNSEAESRIKALGPRAYTSITSDTGVLDQRVLTYDACKCITDTLADYRAGKLPGCPAPVLPKANTNTEA